MRHKDDEELVTKRYLRDELNAMEARMELSTKRIVEQISHDVTTATVGIISDALQLIADRFDQQDLRLARIERKLDRHQEDRDKDRDVLDDHHVRLDRLEKHVFQT